jgi:tripartite-type tricarboxylate transporter receptor subunit TctC
MPEAVTARLHDEIVKALATPDLRARLVSLGATPVGSTPAELAEYVQAELARWTKVVKTAGIQAD